MGLIIRLFYDINAALRYSKKAVAIMEKIFPDGHPDLDVMKDNLESLKR
jgi:hypothetical protein